MPGVLRPAQEAAITGGLWAERRRVNREVSIPGGWDRLHEAGNFHDLELAAGRAQGDYVSELPFLDSDVYKWLEAVGWVLADPELDRDLAERLRAQVAETAALLTATQRDDGYLQSYFQVHAPGERFATLAWGHELYCTGHLIQAAVALHRTVGDAALLGIARRAADLAVASFGTSPGRIDGVCGHPEIETALVELHRETGDPAYLDLARYFVDRRGHGLLGDGSAFGRRYFQDHLPVREADEVVGHAVRQLYLLAGVADLQIEDGDQELRAAAERLWAEMAARKTYLTGGVGAHHQDEAFGDAYELPSERSYCETCAAIASIMFSWRMLMITGEAKYADLLERTLYNGFLAGLSLDGQRYIYANPLQVRDDHVNLGSDGDYERKPWFRCACCPPNVMRLLASLEHYVLLADDHRVVLHQYASGRYTGGELTVEVETDYPWNGVITVRVADAPPESRQLVLRVPEWCDRAVASLTVNDASDPGTPTEGWWAIDRVWRTGDTVRLTLPLRPRFVRADPRVDAARGAVAVERGPLVYCVESADQPGLRLDDLTVGVPGSPGSADPATPDTADPDSADAIVVDADPALGTISALRLRGRTRPRASGSGSGSGSASASWWPYRSVTGAEPYPEPDHAAGPAVDPGRPVELTAVPYYAWGNRGPGAMRIWLPTH